MEIIGERLRIRPLEQKDVFKMKDWGEHENPLFEDYNFPHMTDFQVKKWYEMKTNSFFSRYFAIITKENRLIGYMGIKKIKLLRRESTLGIVFDPNYLDKGYGTETLKYFLKSYFTDMKMKRMYLEVSEFNTRAYRVYEKMGFKDVAYYLEKFSSRSIDITSSYYKDAKAYFVIDDGKLYSYIYKMKLESEVFLENFNNIK